MVNESDVVRVYCVNVCTYITELPREYGKHFWFKKKGREFQEIRVVSQIYNLYAPHQKKQKWFNSKYVNM